MRATTIGVGALRRTRDAAGTIHCRAALWRPGLMRVHAAVLQFFEALVQPGTPLRSAEDEVDWPRYPPF